MFVLRGGPAELGGGAACPILPNRRGCAMWLIGIRKERIFLACARESLPPSLHTSFLPSPHPHNNIVGCWSHRLDVGFQHPWMLVSSIPRGSSWPLGRVAPNWMLGANTPRCWKPTPHDVRSQHPTMLAPNTRRCWWSAPITEAWVLVGSGGRRLRGGQCERPPVAPRGRAGSDDRAG